MPLVLTVEVGQDVMVGDTPVVLSHILEDRRGVLISDNRSVTINSYRWMDVLPNICKARLSRNQNNCNGKNLRIEFDAPTVRVLRGTSYRNKKGTTA